MIRLEFSLEAEQDLESVGDYIAKDNPRRAASFVRELKAQCCKITNAPKGYRERPELGQGIRFCAYGNYVVFFYEKPGFVRIVRILHAAMDIESQFTDG